MLTKVIIIFIGITAVKATYLNFYRRDYTYLKEYDAYYKLHWDINGSSWDAAFLACDNEESQLFYPKTKEERIVPKQLSEMLQEQPNVTDIFIGIHNAFALTEFITVDGHPYPVIEDGQIVADDRQCILMNIETGTYRMNSCYQEAHDTAIPFVCKKVVDREISCPTVDKGYVYKQEVKKCYKVNKREHTWQEAMRTCFMEGGTLAVLENEKELHTVYDLLSRNNKQYFLGIRRFIPYGDFYTVKGKKIEVDGYLNFITQNNVDDMNGLVDDMNVNRRDCVIIYRDYNGNRAIAENCEIRLPFICEIEA